MFENGQLQLTQSLKEIQFLEFNKLSAGSPIPTGYNLSDLGKKIILLLVGVSESCKNQYAIKEIKIPMAQHVTQTALLYFLAENHSFYGKYYEIEGYLLEEDFKAKCIMQLEGNQGM